MRRCPITYELIAGGKYSAAGLKRLSGGLNDLSDLPYTVEEQLQEAADRASKISIQGVQPKLSARINTNQQVFEIVDRNGQFILKPPNPLFPSVPENEDLTMRLAKLAGIDIPLHGLLYSKDGRYTYFIKRFDRLPRAKKLAVEDFAQLSGMSRDTKYNSSMEKVAGIIEKYCTFPVPEKAKLFRLTCFNFLIGNEDMHLKNFSLINRNGKIELTPAYDLLNTTILLKNPAEEMALPVMGKKSKINREILFGYFGKEFLRLTDKVISGIEAVFLNRFPDWQEMIRISFLPGEQKQKYIDCLLERKIRLFPETE